MSESQFTKPNNPLKDILPMVIAEIITAVLVCIGGVLLDFLGIIKDYSFDYSVISGAVLGAAVIVINYVVLITSVDKEIKKFIDNRPEGEMSEEDIQLYTKKQTVSVQNAIKISSTIRLLSMVATLVLAFITGWFNPVAAAIPMFAFRINLTVVELIKSKSYPKPDPAKFIKYDFEDENKDEKEDED